MTSEATEGLFRRWARRKQESKAAPGRAADPAPLPVLAPGQPALKQPALDLPDIETLGAGSDYRAFLQKGVAAEVQRIALQRAWASDEGIAGFRGMADYDWDFNAPTYGKLWASDDVAKLLQAVVSPPAEAEPASTEPVSTEPALAEPAVAALALPEVSQLAQEAETGAGAAGPGQEAEPPRAAAPRHGSAMPA